MNFRALKEAINQLNEEQLDQTVHVLYSADEIVMVELAITTQDEVPILVPKYEF